MVASNTTGPQLFVEIVEDIIDYFSPNDNEDRTVLKKCSQVSKHFAIKAQTLLFQEIKLIDDEILRHSYHNPPASISHRCQRLSNIIDRKPYISGSIKQVTIVLGHANKWISHDIYYIALMERLARTGSSFDSLVLRGHSETKLIDSRTFEEKVFIPFIAPRLVSLHIEDLIDVPLALVSESPHLVDLRLTHAEPAKLSTISPRSTTLPTPAIRNLTVSESRTLLSTLVSHPLLSNPFADFSSLSEYTDHVSASWDFDAAQYVLTEARSLRRLKLLTPTNRKTLIYLLNLHDAPQIYMDGFSTLDFSQSHTLQSFAVSFLFAAQYGDLLTKLAVSLGTILASSALREIEMTIHLLSKNDDTLAALSSADSWKALRRQFDRIAEHNSLQVAVTFRIGLPGHEDRDELCTCAGKDWYAVVEDIQHRLLQSTAEQPNLEFKVSIMFN